MSEDLAGIALAGGEGARLRPLTTLLPKALCPIDGRALVDLALDRLTPLTGADSDHLAVNAHHFAELIGDHCRSRAHVRIEAGEALGTAGAIAGLRPWIDGRAVLITNADAYLPGGLDGFTDGWDGERCRLLCLPTAAPPTAAPPTAAPPTASPPTADFTAADGSGLRYVGACLLPWRRIRDLAVTPSGLYEVLWRDDVAASALDLVALPPDAVAIDCGTPVDYLAANLHASGGRSVVGPGATVLGRLERSVVWPGAWVAPEEILVDTIRAGTRAHPVSVDAAARC